MDRWIRGRWREIHEGGKKKAEIWMEQKWNKFRENFYFDPLRIAPRQREPALIKFPAPLGPFQSY